MEMPVYNMITPHLGNAIPEYKSLHALSFRGTIGGIAVGVMLALVIVLIMAIIVVGALQRRHSKHVLLEEANMDNPKFREMVEESLLKQEVQCSGVDLEISEGGFKVDYKGQS